MINNMKHLIEDPKSDNFDVINGFKFLGFMMVIIAHRLLFDLLTPTFNIEFYDYVRSNNNIFYFVKNCIKNNYNLSKRCWV